MRVLAGVLALLAVSCDAPAEVTAAPQGQSPSVEKAADSDQLGSSEELREGKIWKGTIGDMPITACFYDEKSNEGAYYYDKNLIPLRLVAMEESTATTLTEVEGFSTQSGATWTVDRKTGDVFAGSWRNGTGRNGTGRNGARELEIKLKASSIQLSEYGDGCQSAEFVAPLLKGGGVTQSTASFENVTYTKLEYSGPKRPGLDDYTFSSLKIGDVRPGDKAINEKLAAILPGATEDSSMGQCVGMSIATGQLGYWEEIAQPTVLAPDWLGISRSGSQFCGGAHPNHFLWLAVYDRQSGKEVDASTWFKDGALTFYDFEGALEGEGARPIQAASDTLLDAIIAHWPDNPDAGEGETCANREFLRSGWQLGLSQEGVIFVHEFPHVVFACTAEVVVPWAQLDPFLSQEGQRVRASLQ